MSIYLDNGATSYPKPPEVVTAVTDALTNYPGSLGRSHSKTMNQLEHRLYDIRMAVANLFNMNNADHVVFTRNVTESLNLVIQGVVEPGDEVVISSLEHNAVVRPLEALKHHGVQTIIIPNDPHGQIDLEQLEKALKTLPKLMVINHVSNVTGDIQNLEAVAALAAQYEVPLVVDAAQSAGILPIDMLALSLSAVAFTGHKTLMGPQGIGGLVLSKPFAKRLRPLVYGGTGSLSEYFEQPTLMPDKFESGTQNLPGILGLGAGIDFLRRITPEVILEHERKLISLLQAGVSNLSHIRIIGNPDSYKRLGVLSLDFSQDDNSRIAYALSKNYEIATRVGLHCAPLAHKSYGTFSSGTVRFSTSYFNTEEDILNTIKAINEIIKD